MPSLEVEVKIPVDCGELNSILERLRGLGARVEGPLREEDVYLQHPCRDVIARDEAVRVRLSRGRARLTYKGPRIPRGDVKARIEVEAEASPEILEVLEALGFREALRVVKERIYASLPSASVTLDRVEGLGCFVEVEASTGDPREVEEALRLLGLDGRPRVTESYASMLAGRRGGARP